MSDGAKLTFPGADGAPAQILNLVAASTGKVLRSVEAFKGVPLAAWTYGLQELSVKISPAAQSESGGWYQIENPSVGDRPEILLRLGETLPANAIHQIAAHETGHALLDALNQNMSILEPPPRDGANFDSFEVSAFHESFGDLVIMLSDLLDPEVAIRELTTDRDRPELDGMMRVRGTLDLVGLGVLPTPRSKANPRWLYAEWANLPNSATDVIKNEHSFSQIFSGCIFDLVNMLLRTAYRLYKKDKELSVDDSKVEAARFVAKEVGWLLFNAAGQCVPKAAYFRSIARSLYTWKSYPQSSPPGHDYWAFRPEIEKALSLRKLWQSSLAWTIPGARSMDLCWIPVAEAGIHELGEPERIESRGLVIGQEFLLDRQRTSIEGMQRKAKIYSRTLPLDKGVHPGLEGVKVRIVEEFDFLDLPLSRGGLDHYMLRDGASELERRLVNAQGERPTWIGPYVNFLIASGRIFYNDPRIQQNSNAGFTHFVDRSNGELLLRRLAFVDIFDFNQSAHADVTGDNVGRSINTPAPETKIPTN